MHTIIYGISRFREQNPIILLQDHPINKFMKENTFLSLLIPMSLSSESKAKYIGPLLGRALIVVAKTMIQQLYDSFPLLLHCFLVAASLE
jgi:hypothetical protein